jgi:hypothetical protein
VRLALRANARARGTNQKQAAPLGHREADKIVASIDTQGMRPKDVRDLALMLAGRDLLARASELVSITAESITFDDDDTWRCLRSATDATRSCRTICRSQLRSWMSWSWHRCGRRTLAAPGAVRSRGTRAPDGAPLRLAGSARGAAS